VRKSIENFKKLCEDFRQFSFDERGGGSNYYCNDQVRCYFSNNSDHTNVEIAGFEINFFNSPEIGFPIHKVDMIDNIIIEYRGKLNVLIAEYNKRTEQEIQEAKVIEIDSLEKRLNELKDGSK